jgi:DNA end-binding protein Ku
MIELIRRRDPHRPDRWKIYFGDVCIGDMLDLAKHIVETKAGHFEPAKFEDHYEAALQELLEKKQKGQPIAAAKKTTPSNVYNLMDALRASIKGGQRTPAEKPAKAAKKSKAAKPAAKRKAS